MVRLVVAPRPQPPQDQTCVWMNAGLLAYKLCDRNFDCEHCPLDAALRGDADAPSRAAHAQRVVSFPNDRLYTRGHTWVREPGGIGGDPMRFGLDGFAALFVGSARRVRMRPTRCPLGQGQTICAVELGDGELALGMPVSGSVLRWNDGLVEHPSRLAADPYGAGWIVELKAASAEEFGDLLPSEEARHRTRLDLRRFRRHVGLELLTERDDAGPHAPLDEEAITDLHRMLGGRFMAIVQDLVY